MSHGDGGTSGTQGQCHGRSGGHDWRLMDSEHTTFPYSKDLRIPEPHNPVKS